MQAGTTELTVLITEVLVKDKTRSGLRDTDVREQRPNLRALRAVRVERSKEREKVIKEGGKHKVVQQNPTFKGLFQV